MLSFDPVDGFLGAGGEDSSDMLEGKTILELSKESEKTVESQKMVGSSIRGR